MAERSRRLQNGSSLRWESAMADLAPIYSALHAILVPYARKLDAKRDTDAELWLDTRHLQKNGKPHFFGAVQLKKSYVSFHLMPVYVKPDLLDDISPDLRARMQGKSCFNFKSVEPKLFEELGALTKEAYSSYRKQGFV
jgi:hypothetical protein